MADDKPRKPDDSAQRDDSSSQGEGSSKGTKGAAKSGSSTKGQQNQESLPRQSREGQGMKRSEATRPSSTSASRPAGKGQGAQQAGAASASSAQASQGGPAARRGVGAAQGSAQGSRPHPPKDLGAPQVGAGGTGAAGQGPASTPPRSGAGSRADSGAGESTPGGSTPARAGSDQAASGGKAAGVGDAGSSGSAAGATGAAGGAAGAANAAGTADKAQKASKGMDGLAGQVAGGATQKALEGDGSSGARRNVGRYAGAGVSGAVAGAQAGAAAGGVGAVPGAAIGAAKGMGVEAGKDAVEGVSKVTGGSPVAEPADKRLGAGGTGFQRETKQEDSTGKKVAKAAAVGGAAAATPPALALIALMQLLAWLKTLFFQAAAMAANAGNWLLSMAITFAQSVGKLVATPFMALGSFVAKGASAAFGVTAAAVAPVTALTSAIAVTIGGGMFAWGLFASALDGTVDGGVGNTGSVCTVSDSRGGGGGQTGPISANTEENAKRVYSVLSSMGMPDENIAGILGNWSQESGIDPTSVEGIFTEPFSIGPRKQAAWDGNFTHIPGQSHGGIGLGQWSNGRTPMLLDYAESKGLDWYTIEAQLAFMVQGDNPSDVEVFKGMIETPLGSPAAAAKHFHDKWERSADNAAMMAEREADAEMWFGKMSGWEVDDSALGDIEDIIGDLIGDFEDGVRNIMGLCDQDGGFGGGLAEGGMNEEQAQALVDLYNEEGDAFLDERYGESGGPGSCGSNHAMNCVSFSTYFANKYTSFQQYAPGNGIQTAHSMASMMGKEVSDTPTPYSVGSGPGSGAAGHTLVVLGVEGDKVIVGEAGYCAYMGRVRVTTIQELQADGWKFVDLADLVGEGGSDPDGLPDVNSDSGSYSPSSSEVVNAARSQIGKPYVWGGGGVDGPGPGRQSVDAGEVGFDCSGLTSYAYYQATGQRLPRISSQQKSQGAVISKSEAKPGDLVWWPGHVGIYSGGDKVVHASGSQNKVVESGLWGSPVFLRM